jgi:D-lactate dehydrogenase
VILYLVALEPDEEHFYRDLLPDQDLRFVPDGPSVLEDAEGVCVFIDTLITREFLEEHPSLTFIATRTGAIDHIDADACRSRGITITYVRSYGETTVAEHTFALILALSRRLREAMQSPEKGRFSYRHARGFDLAGKTLGVIGMGRVGQKVAALARCFGMRVVAFDPVEMSPDFGREHSIEWLPLDELLSQSHVITLHVMLSALTHHILNAETFALCRRGVLIVNTARGGLIDTAALQGALDSGQVGGAGLDVLEDERVLRRAATDIISSEIVEHLQTDSAPQRDRIRDLERIMQSNSLLTKPNVVFTPHVAFNTVEAVARLNEITAGNIRAYLDGTPRDVA